MYSPNGYYAREVQTEACVKVTIIVQIIWTNVSCTYKLSGLEVN